MRRRDTASAHEAGASPRRYWPFVSVVLEGEPARPDCQDLAVLLIYEVGFGATWRIRGYEGIENPGWDLDEARRLFRGEEPCIVQDGCRYQFSLRPWRRVPPDAWRVIPMVLRHDDPPEMSEFYRTWQTLGELRAGSQGDQTVVTDPNGQRHVLSLRPWDELSANWTRLSVRFAADYGHCRRWWQPLYRRVLFEAVEWERAKGDDPSPRRFNPSRTVRDKGSVASGH